MAANTTTPQEVHNQRLLEREIRSMISTLTGHLSGQAVDGGEEDAGGGGMRIVTLAGANKGVMMEGRDMDVDSHGVIYGDDGQLSAFANSNYQAVNNSIMLGGSCTAEDPGVHLLITEYDDDDEEETPVMMDSDHVEETKKKKKTTGQEAETIKSELSVENGLNKARPVARN